ncbi:MAG: preprotein translocase subunit SecA [Balneolales bacterium]|nr:preprotein translocase subunit SecA [Balneolales bacterium]
MLDSIIKGITQIFGSSSDKEMKRIQPLVKEINSIAEELTSISDDELRAYTQRFKDDIRNATAEIDEEINTIKKKLNLSEDSITIEERRGLSEDLDRLAEEWLSVAEAELEEILPEAFAVLKETCRRFVGKKWMVAGSEVEWQMVPYDVQLVGGIVLHQGKIAEMKTGEGKTLVAVFPTYLNALVGRGVHIVTVNTYLAQRDAEWNAPIFEFHGLKVDCIDRYQPNSPERRNAYQADITYGTNNEFGFDYLRDNMTHRADELMQRGFHFTIIDEVDSVLIDEARTPLIISGPVPQDDQGAKYIEFRPRIQALVEAQKKLITKFVSEAEQLVKEGDDQEAGLRLFRAQRGFPKNRKFEKLMQDPQMQRLVQQTEYLYLQEQGKNMPFVDEAMYYAVNLKQNSIELTDMGREFITRSGEDEDFFVIPDIGTETSQLQEKFDEEKELVTKKHKEDKTVDAETRERNIAKEIEDLRSKLNEEKQTMYARFAERSERIHTVNNLLKAYTLYEKDDEYIIQDNKVQIVDIHTGRVLPGRRYSDGLHQAIEAKENVKVEAATQTYATITLQNFFRMYHKLAGMTGTASTEDTEFHEIYKLDVVEIPTNKPIQRKDLDDLLFYTKREKYNAIIKAVEENVRKGQPTLVGTTSVEVSETLSRMLKRTGIPHNVLNAKQHARESEIVADAGKRGAVTIATNMAGRGTDIKLTKEILDIGGLAILGSERHESRRIDLQLRGRAGRQGDPGVSQFYVSLEDDLMKLFGSDRIINTLEKFKHEEGEVIQNRFLTKQLEKAQSKVEQNNYSIRKRSLEFDDVLNNQRKVVYSRRRNALMGERLSSDTLDMLEDHVYRIAEEHYVKGEYESIQERMLRSLAVAIEIDREKWAGWGVDGVADYLFDESVKQFRQRNDTICRQTFELINGLVNNPEITTMTPEVSTIFTDGSRLFRVVLNVERTIESEGRELLTAIQRAAVLSVIDVKWMEHLRELDQLKEAIGLRSFGQRDPLREFKKEAYEAFMQLMEEMNAETLSMIWKAVPQQAPDNRQQIKMGGAAAKSRYDRSRMQEQHSSTSTYGAGNYVTSSSGGGSQQLGTNRSNGDDAPKKPVVLGKKFGRNEPCPLDPDKKFKHCCGANGSKTCQRVGEGALS